ncbi:MAG: hypothetical protein LBD62_00415 [Candidatus Margulisbacteria bacterium]|jgi:hypothetical protein|nr:hypothetical protein [Candidatus Margulisiibacteriota bacterium]
MQTKIVEYIERKYPGYTARPGMEHQAYLLETHMAGLTADDLQQLRAQQLILAKIPKETAPQNEDTSREGKELIEFMRKKYKQGIPAEVIEETAEIIAARDNLKNLLAFFLCNCEISFQKKLSLDTSYKFNLTIETLEKANFLIISHDEKKYHLNHKLGELLFQQVSAGEHDFVFYLNAEKEIGLRIDGVDFIRPEPSATPSQP